MRFALDEDQTALRDGVRSMLRGECPPAVVRAAWRDTPDADPARVRQLWHALAEMGIPRAAVPERLGGLGLDACTVVPLIEETGRFGVPLPVVETAFVTGPLLATAPDAAELLERLVAGELLVACSLEGSPLVAYAGVADLALLSENAATGRPISVLDPRTDTTPVVALDGARVVGRLIDPRHRRSAVILDVSAGDCVAAWWRGVLGSAAELIGLARGLLELTTAYVTERRQFGVPVGSFQAIKHHLSDALIAIEFAAPPVMRAAWSMDQGLPTTHRDVAMAKAMASDAAEHVARVALQCHGAIAYTTEYDLHLLAKRVWASVRTWGSADAHRDFIASHLGLAP